MGQLGEGSVRIAEPAEDKRLHEGGTSEDAGPLDEAGVMGGLIGDGGDEGLQRGGEVGDTDHGTLLDAGDASTPSACAKERSLSNLTPMGRFANRPTALRRSLTRWMWQGLWAVVPRRDRPYAMIRRGNAPAI